MIKNLQAAAAAIQPQPLNPRELITDETLTQFERDFADIQGTTLSAEDQAALAMYLPDICGELIARRKAMGRVDIGHVLLAHEHMLRHLAKIDAAGNCGEFSSEDQRILAKHLGDICAELLTRRRMMAPRAAQISAQQTAFFKRAAGGIL